MSPGCANCYAATRNHRFGNDNWGNGKPRRLTADWKKPIRWHNAGSVCVDCWKPRGADSDCECGQIGALNKTRSPRVFPSICDWLDDEVPIEWLCRFIELIHNTPHLDWLLLTKRPENFRKAMASVIDGGRGERIGCGVAMDWRGGYAPGNVWIGVSVEDQQRACERIPELLKIPANVRWLSVEPMLGPIDLGLGRNGHTLQRRIADDIHWVVVGGESGSHARQCNVEWIRDIVNQCADANVPCFVKQVGSNAKGSAGADYTTKHPKGGDPEEWQEDLRVRQFPEVAR